jgi:hypothetical protein
MQADPGTNSKRLWGADLDPEFRHVSNASHDDAFLPGGILHDIHFRSCQFSYVIRLANQCGGADGAVVQ